MTPRLAILLSLAVAANAGAGERYNFAQAERLEYRSDQDDMLWDFQGRYGGDYHRFWWKTEGEFASGSTEEAELQLLYSRAWTAFFDLQAGVRLQEIAGTDVNSLVLGVQGLAPYRFESDIALFLSEDGDLTARMEFERDLVVGRKTVIQPRAELGVAFQDIPELELYSGVHEIAVGVRVRYEFTRKFAPYVGLSYTTALGQTANHIESAGDRKAETSFVAGLRFWF